MTRQQRTVFGEVADTYDAVRATYPDELIDNVIEITRLSNNSSVLDIGCGTGILARSFVDRGHKLLGIEPSPEMARVARRKFSRNLDFRLHLVDFQAWSPGQERFDLVVAGQSWHWMDPVTRFSHAARALRDDGHMALFWNTPQRGRGPLRDALDTAYAANAPTLAAGPPGSKSGLNGADPADEISESDSFSLLSVADSAWTRTYNRDEYLLLLSTQSDHRLLDEPSRASLFSAVSQAINDVGEGSIAIDHVCTAYIAARR